MVEQWVKLLDSLCGINEPRLEDKIYSMLRDGEAYANNPEKHQESISLLGKLIVAHAEHRRVKGVFGDLFGDYLIEREIPLNKGLGQVFTPEPITQMIAEMTLGSDAELDGKPRFISDPAAGTGRFMLSTAKRYAERIGKLNFVFFNVDLEFRAYVFCVMNAVLNGVPAVTVRGDSLKMEFYEGFVTLPLPFSRVAEWHRITGERAKEIFTSSCRPAVQVQTRTGQLTLMEVLA